MAVVAMNQASKRPDGRALDREEGVVVVLDAGSKAEAAFA